MPSRRDQIQMSSDEFWSFVDSQKTVQVATLLRDGSPHLVPLWFAIDRGRIVLETFTKSQKVRNLERDPRISLLFEDGSDYEKLRGASISARAELISEDAKVHNFHKLVLLRNAPELGEEVIERVSASMAAKKTAILVKPEKIFSWDHSNLGGVY